jgi:eukaryotic-like serine/threonine-protein kinase
MLQSCMIANQRLKAGPFPPPDRRATLAALPMGELREGQLINASIRLDRMLGRGGMGSLWIAYHLRLKVRVVVKFIAAEFAGNPDVMARFQREAAATMAAKSAHVVQILDYGFTEDMVPFIAMEYLEGEDLATRMAREVRITPWEFSLILKQACKGLTRAHAQGIIHRDIKPENIFLTYVDDELVVKVLDFGIAKADSAAMDCPPTRTGVFLGTVYYMSPEQTMGARNVDHRTDLWSLGVVTYYALTGVLPFEGDAIGNLVEQITASTIRPPSQHLPALGPAIDAWMRRALARHVNQRFGSAKDMALAFEAALTQLAPWAAAVTLESSNTEPKVNMGTVAVLGTAGRHQEEIPYVSEGPEQSLAARMSATPVQSAATRASATPVQSAAPRASATPVQRAIGFGSPTSLADLTAPAMSAPARAAAISSQDQIVDMPNKRSRPLFIGIGVGVGIALALVGFLSLRSSTPVERPGASANDAKPLESPSPSVAALHATPAPPAPTLAAPPPAPAPVPAPSASATVSVTRAGPAVVNRRPPARPNVPHSGDSNPFDGTY